MFVNTVNKPLLRHLRATGIRNLVSLNLLSETFYAYIF